MTPPIISLDGITKDFVRPLDLAARAANLFGASQQATVVRAIDDVTLAVNEGEVVGLVGESGCGKSTLGRIVAGIYEPTKGTVTFRGRPVAGLAGAAGRDAALKVQMIFQDPTGSLNPRMRLADIVGEAPVVHGLVARVDVGA
jgi:peptide/nickel transport system ATP-binding protein